MPDGVAGVGLGIAVQGFALRSPKERKWTLESLFGIPCSGNYRPSCTQNTTLMSAPGNHFS